MIAHGSLGSVDSSSFHPAFARRGFLLVSLSPDKETYRGDQADDGEYDGCYDKHFENEHSNFCSGNECA